MTTPSTTTTVQASCQIIDPNSSITSEDCSLIVEIDEPSKRLVALEVILTAPDSGRWRVTVNNLGILTTSPA